jgi:hypothetical protein
MKTHPNSVNQDSSHVEDFSVSCFLNGTAIVAKSNVHNARHDAFSQRFQVFGSTHVSFEELEDILLDATDSANLG